MEETYRVRPHILRSVLDEEHEQVAVADVDGKPALLVPVTEPAVELARGVFPGLEALPVSVEEIERVCSNHALALVGFLGFEPPENDGPPPLSVVSAEAVGLVLEEQA